MKKTKVLNKSETKDRRKRLQESNGYTVNAKIHLTEDVPEEVQQFIKSISSDPKPDEEKNLSDMKLLGAKKRNTVKLPQNCSPPNSGQSSRRASVQVIVTTDFEPNKLSNVDYDRLKKVPYKL